MEDKPESKYLLFDLVTLYFSALLFPIILLW